MGERGYWGLTSFHQGTIMSECRISPSQMMHLLTQISRHTCEAAGIAGWHSEAGTGGRGAGPLPPFWNPLEEAPHAESPEACQGGAQALEMF